MPEVEGLRKIGDEVAGVGDAEDLRTGCGLREKMAGDECQQDDESIFCFGHCFRETASFVSRCRRLSAGRVAGVFIRVIFRVTRIIMTARG